MRYSHTLAPSGVWWDPPVALSPTPCTDRHPPGAIRSSHWFTSRCRSNVAMPIQLFSGFGLGFEAGRLLRRRKADRLVS